MWGSTPFSYFSTPNLLEALKAKALTGKTSKELQDLCASLSSSHVAPQTMVEWTDADGFRYTIEFDDDSNVQNGEHVSFTEVRITQRVFAPESCSYKVGWVIKDSVFRCTNVQCNIEFGVFNWKHSCRMCGAVLCSECMPNTLSIPECVELGESASKVCMDCFGRSALHRNITNLYKSSSPQRYQDGQKDVNDAKYAEIDGGHTKVEVDEEVDAVMEALNVEFDSLLAAEHAQAEGFLFVKSDKFLDTSPKLEGVNSSESSPKSIGENVNIIDEVIANVDKDKNEKRMDNAVPICRRNNIESTIIESGLVGTCAAHVRNGEECLPSSSLEESVDVNLKHDNNKEEHIGIREKKHDISNVDSDKNHSPMGEKVRSIGGSPKIGPHLLRKTSSSSSSSSTPSSLSATLSLNGSLAVTQQKLKEYEAAQEHKYADAYRLMRKLIPLNISQLSVANAVSMGLPETIARRFWEKKTLWLIVMHSEDIQKIHIADLRGKYQALNLDIVEMRAIKHVLPDWGSNNPKANWLEDFTRKLNELAHDEDIGKISEQRKRNMAYKGYESLELFDPDAVVVTKYDKLFNNSSTGPVIKKLNTSGMNDCKGENTSVPPYEMWKQEAKEAQEANAMDYNCLDDIFSSPKSRSSLEYGRTCAICESPSPQNLCPDEVDDTPALHLGHVGPKSISAAAPGTAFNADPVETPSLTITSAAVETNSFAKALAAAKLRMQQRELGTLGVVRESSVEEEEKLQFDEVNGRRKFEEDNRKKVKLEIVKGKAFEHTKSQESFDEMKQSDESSDLVTVEDGDGSSIANTTFEEDSGTDDGIEYNVDPTSTNEVSINGAKDLSTIVKSSISMMDCCSSSQQTTLPSEEKNWFDLDSLLCREGITDNSSSDRSQGLENEDFDKWTNGSRRNSSASNVSSGVFLSDDSGYHEGTDNVGFVDLFYNLIGLSSVPVVEDGVQKVGCDGDVDEQYNSDNVVTVAAAADEVCSEDDETSLCTSSECSILKQHVEEEHAELVQEIYTLRALLKSKEDNLAKKLAFKKQKDVEISKDLDMTPRIAEEFNDFEEAELKLSSASNKKMISTNNDAHMEGLYINRNDPTERSLSEDENPVNKIDDIDDKSCTSAGKMSSFSVTATSDIASGSCTDTTSSCEWFSARSTTNECSKLHYGDTTSFVTVSGRNSLKITPPLIEDFHRNHSDHSPELPTSPFVSATPPSRPSYESISSALPLARLHTSSHKVRPHTGANMSCIVKEQDVMMDCDLLSSADIIARIKLKHSRDSLSKLDSYAVSSPPSSEIEQWTICNDVVNRPLVEHPSVIPLPSASEAWSTILSGECVELDKLRCVLEARNLYPVKDFDDIFSCEKANKLLLQVAADPDALRNPLGSMTFLVTDMKADVNIRDVDGRTPLALLFNNPTLGRFLMANGADVFMKDTGDESGQSVLALCTEFNEQWLLEEFLELNAEIAILHDGKKMKEYVHALIAAGYATRAKVFIDEGYVIVDAQFASSIMKEIHAEFSSGSMKEPVETFELLISLGAEV